MKCKNSGCKNEIDALHMNNEGYCINCHNDFLNNLLIEESRNKNHYLANHSKLHQEKSE